MNFLDLTLDTPAANLALDEALLLEAEEGRAGEILRLWEWPRPAVVLGAGCRLARDVNETACVADGVPIVRRGSGGGTVLLGQGCLLFSLILAYERDEALREVRTSYQYILDCVRAALRDALPNAALAGISDLACAGRKFSGNAQQRKRHYLLHHGTLLYRFDLAQVARYLHAPERQPDYRGGRSHDAFLMNVLLCRYELCSKLQDAWEARPGTTDWPREVVNRLVAERYDQPEWTRRR